MNHTQRDSSKAGFTLLETLIAVFVMLIALASIVSTFIVFANSSKSVGSYVAMNTESRNGLEIYARDVRAALDITSATATSITISYPNNSFYNGSTVEYGGCPTSC